MAQRFIYLFILFAYRPENFSCLKFILYFILEITRHHNIIVMGSLIVGLWNFDRILPNVIALLFVALHG